MMMKKFLSMALALCMLLALLPAKAFAFSDSPFGSGTGEDAATAYYISTEDQLRALANLVNTGDTNYNSKYYKLTADITLDGAWTPIGTYDNKFNGHFDGDGHTISDLSIASGGNIGLFGYADNGSQIKNLGLKDISITATGSYAGGVAGYSSGSVSACWVSGSITSTSTMVGGVVGSIHDGGSITNCYASVIVSGTGSIGGVVGSTRGSVSFCYATGSVSCSGSSVGGIVGWRYYTTQISNCAALNVSVSGGSNVGRIVGGTSETANLNGNIALADMAGGDFGADRGITTKNGADKTVSQIAAAGFWTKDIDHFQDDWSSTIWDKAAGRLPMLKNFSLNQPQQPFPFGGVDGSDADNAYLISSEYQLRLLALLVNAANTNYNDKYYQLTADINLHDEWTPIGTNTYRFKGHFNGAVHVISNLSITGDNYLGLFGCNDTGSSVSDLVLQNAAITGNSSVGGVVGTTYGTITNCTVSGKVHGSVKVGGIVGMAGDSAHPATIKNCGSTATVTGETGPSSQDVGGVIGFLSNNSVASNCYATGDVSGKTHVGGIVGQNPGAISNCYATGAVSGIDAVGGIAGYVANRPLLNCVALNPSVSGDSSVGRVFGIKGSVSTPFDTAAFAGMTGGDFGTDSGANTKNGADLNLLGITATINTTFSDNTSIFPNPWASCNFSSLPGLTGISTVSKPNHLYCTVSFDANGGSVSPSSAIADENGNLSSLPIPTKAGYSFGGWYPAADASGTAITTTTVFENSATVYAKWASSHTGGNSSSRTISVSETSSALFNGLQKPIKAEANMNSAFSNSVEVKVTDTNERANNFGLGIGNTVYPFDISLYIKGTNTKTDPKDGYAVTISLPIPDNLLDVKEQLSIAHKTNDGIVTTLTSQIKQINGIWYLVFEATKFSPYAVVLNSTSAYDETTGLAYYVDRNGNKLFLGFAANGKYIAPSAVTVLFQENTKPFTDIGSHWAKDYIEFVTKRELFLGTENNAFSPNLGMTRAMFATVVGRLYERSFGEIEASGTHVFTDCNYDAYYGKYVDWAAKEGIISGYGNGKFSPNTAITREQMAAMLYRFADFLNVLPNNTETALNYPDANSITSYARNAALYCQMTGIIAGRDDGKFVPQGAVTRAEVATIVQRYIKAVMG